MYRELYENEQKWIDYLLSAEFKGKDILVKQIACAKVTCKQADTYISLRFYIEDKIELYPYQVRVPVEMRAFQKSSAPIVFLLHLHDGAINELEIITADSSHLYADKIELEQIEYVINEDVLTK